MQEPLVYDFTGQALSPHELTELEQQLGGPLPEDYRRFLLQTNGGIPSRQLFLVGPDPERDMRWVDDFIIVDDRLARPDDNDPSNTLSYQTYGWGHAIPSNTIIIGRACRDSLLLLCLCDSRRGQVHLVDMDLIPPEIDDPTAEDFEMARLVVAPSFGAFLDLLFAREADAQQAALRWIEQNKNRVIHRNEKGRVKGEH